MVLAVVLHAADIQDRDGAKLVVERLLGRFARLELIWAGAAYAGELVGWVKKLFRVGARGREAPGGAKRVRGAPPRLGSGANAGVVRANRRLSKDYEERAASGEAIILIAMINLMVHRLEPD